nr:hypothetical protein HeiferVagina-S102_00024 [Bovine alphaherpesvirus 1]WHT50228.1 hypothetical protein Milk-S104_00024 [Bovine alphaherpesvirus 1]WHT50316.1 hypothetical protein Docile-S101_00024 [Bovine alphaherpesvirus 1]
MRASTLTVVSALPGMRRASSATVARVAASGACRHTASASDGERRPGSQSAARMANSAPSAGSSAPPPSGTGRRAPPPPGARALTATRPASASARTPSSVLHMYSCFCTRSRRVKFTRCMKAPMSAATTRSAGVSSSAPPPLPPPGGAPRPSPPSPPPPGGARAGRSPRSASEKHSAPRDATPWRRGSVAASSPA